MATSFLSLQPHPLLSPSLDRTRPSHPLPPFAYGFFKRKPLLLRRTDLGFGDSAVARSGLSPLFSDPEEAEGLVRELLCRAEGLLYTVADAAVSSDAANASKQNGDWLSGITNYLETVLKVLKDGLSTLHVPYAYGFAIILLTVLVKAATFPLTKRQMLDKKGGWDG